MKSTYQQSTIALSATTNTTAIDVSDINDIGVQIDVTTNANTGTFTVQGSNTNSVFTDITLDPAIAALAGANTNIFVSLTDFSFRYFIVLLYFTPSFF